jgi:predicted Zn-dependent peptidase
MMKTVFSVVVMSSFLILANTSVSAAPPSEATPDNGLTVRLVPLDGERKVVVMLGVKSGFFDEPAGFPHLAHITEHLVVFGVPAGSDEDKAADRWFREGRSNGETLPGWMYFDLHVQPNELQLALKVQAMRLARPVFTDEILAREIPRALGELEHLERSDSYGTGKFAFIPFLQAANYGKTDALIKAKSREITVEEVRRFHAATFRPDRAILCVVGDFDPIEIHKAIDETFGTIEKPAPATERPGHCKVDVETVRWDAKTRHLFLGWPAPPPESPDHAALSVAAEPLSRRLNSDSDIATLAKMPMVTNEVRGWFLINVQAKPGVDLDALKKALLAQVRQFSAPDAFAEIQITQARLALLQTLRPVDGRALLPFLRSSVLTKRTNQELQRMGRAIVWGDLDGYAKQVEALDGAEVREAVGRLLDPEKAVVVRVIPSE